MKENLSQPEAISTTRALSSSRWFLPLAKYGLFAALEDLFPQAWQDGFFAAASHTPPEKAYRKWPMGNEGFITTSEPESALEIIRNFGLEGKLVGMVEAAVDGRTGVQLVGIKGSDGKDVYYSGKSA